MPNFTDPLDDALDDFHLAFEQLPKGPRLHLLEGLEKLTAVVREVRDEQQRA